MLPVTVTSSPTDASKLAGRTAIPPVASCTCTVFFKLAATIPLIVTVSPKDFERASAMEMRSTAVPGSSGFSVVEPM